MSDWSIKFMQTPLEFAIVTSEDSQDGLAYCDMQHDPDLMPEAVVDSGRVYRYLGDLHAHLLPFLQAGFEITVTAAPKRGIEIKMSKSF